MPRRVQDCQAKGTRKMSQIIVQVIVITISKEQCKVMITKSPWQLSTSKYLIKLEENRIKRMRNMHKNN